MELMAVLDWVRVEWPVKRVLVNEAEELHSVTAHKKTRPVNKNGVFRLVLTDEQNCSLVAEGANEKSD
jgi:hypothetical protein